MTRLSPSCAVAFVLLASACAHEGGETRGPALAEGRGGSPPVEFHAPPAPEEGKACATDQECGPSELCVAARCKTIASEMAACSAAVSHFGFDQYTLQDADLPALQRAARCLSAVRGMRVRIEGHADERGTTAYNLALGDRRAAAVQRYLVTLGAATEQIETVTYGKERPVCLAHDEGCWAQNRRAQVGQRF